MVQQTLQIVRDVVRDNTYQKQVLQVSLNEDFVNETSHCFATTGATGRTKRLRYTDIEQLDVATFSGATCPNEGRHAPIVPMKLAGEDITVVWQRSMHFEYEEQPSRVKDNICIRPMDVPNQATIPTHR